MNAPTQIRGVLCFGAFEADLCARELRKAGVKVRLQEQPFQLLALLLEDAGKVVTRDDLRQRLWPADTFVGFDDSLNTAIKKLRDALEDSAETPRFIETLPKLGYRFVQSVNSAASDPPLSALDAPEQAIQVLPRPVSTSPKVWSRRRAVFPIAILVAALLLAIYALRPRFVPQPKLSGESKIMLAVLPFENLSGDPEQEFFSDGLTEEMITQMGGLEPANLGVIARTSSM